MMSQATPVNRKKEYIIYSIASAVLYMIPVVYFLFNRQYSNLYLLIIGNFLFGGIIAIYTFKSSNRDKNETSVSIIKQAHIIILEGILWSAILSLITVLIFFPGLFSWHTESSLVHNLPGDFNMHYPAGILLMILFDIIICNMVVGSFVNIMLVFVWKRVRRN